MARTTSVSPDLIDGDVDVGYGRIADAFRNNFIDAGEVGAALTIFRDGRKVVDLWGGLQNPHALKPWRRDTLVTVFSSTKGVAALTIAVAASRGLIDYDAEVARYWPAFAHAGKADVTVRQLLAHQAGLVVIDPPLTLAELRDPEKLSRRIAAQAPSWPPGTRHGYHAVTLGWYESELIRRVDRDRRTLSAFLADEVARPLDLDFHVGLPARVDWDRLAQLQLPTKLEVLRRLLSGSPRQAYLSLNPFGLTAKAGTVAVGLARTDVNSEQLRTLEIPAGNGMGTARSIARLYGDAATGGARIGLSSQVFDALTAPDRPPVHGRRDVMSGAEAAYSLGFSKPTTRFAFGSSHRAFGTPGAGGSFGFADPDTGIGFAYVMNRMGAFRVSDPRERALRQALFRDVLNTRDQT